MDRILITGATGFVGSSLVPYLQAEGKEIIDPGREILTSAIPAYNEIVHLAGKAHDIKKVSVPEEYYDTNYELTKKLFDDFLNSGAKKFIFISSVKAAADKLDHELVEEDIPNPQTHYGKSKLMAEQYIQNQPLPEGKSYYILRPCMIHGPGNKGNLNLLYKFVANGLPYPLATFENKRSFLSVENLCFIIKELLENGEVPSGIYNVADDEPLSTNEIISLLSIARGRSPRFLSIPPVFIRVLAKAGDFLGLPLNTERLQKLIESFTVSNKKIMEAIKKKLPLSAREGLLRTARSFKDA